MPIPYDVYLCVRRIVRIAVKSTKRNINHIAQKNGYQYVPIAALFILVEQTKKYLISFLSLIQQQHYLSKRRFPHLLNSLLALDFYS